MMENNDWESLRRGTAERVEAVRTRIADAAIRSGRAADAVKMVAVTKYGTGQEGLEAALLAAGCQDFGENRPQRLLDKIHFLAEQGKNFSAETKQYSVDFHSIRWNFIGSLQRNKVRRILPHVSLIHSVDTPELFEAIDRIITEESERKETPNAEPASRSLATPPFPERIPILFEVNISGEGNKHGFSPDDFLDRVGLVVERSGRIILRGLMGMGGLNSSPGEVRRQFATLRRLFEDFRRAFPQITEFTELSMGMSGDFEIAIEEGTTIVRIGSLLYPERF